MPLEIKELSPQERRRVSELVIGKTTCPYCKNDDVGVVNNRGPKGDPRFNYLQNHYPSNSDRLCFGSEKKLTDFD